MTLFKGILFKCTVFSTIVATFATSEKKKKKLISCSHTMKWVIASSAVSLLHPPEKQAACFASNA